MYTALAAHILFPLHEGLKHHTTVAVRRNMEQSQIMCLLKRVKFIIIVLESG